MTPLDTRAAVTQAAVTRLADQAPEPRDLLEEVSQRIHRAVPSSQRCYMTVDPDTMLPTHTVSELGLTEVRRAYWRSELLVPDDVNTFADLAARPVPVATMSTLDPAQRATSHRRRGILEPSNLADELRMVFRSNGTVWGAACLVREQGSRLFSAAERQLVISLVDEVGRGLRRGLSRHARSAANPRPASPPGVVMLDADLRPQTATPEAARWLARMPDHSDTSVFAVAVQAQADAARAHARIPLVDGSWLMLQAAGLRGGPPEDERVAVVLEPTGGAELTSLCLRMYGLSPRERQATELLLAGLSVDQVSARMFISRHTLRDHVKAIFAKLGVSSRSEMTALLAGTVEDAERAA